MGKSHSFIFHSACIWGLEIFPHSDQQAQANSPNKPVLPAGSFITCSSDDTIRIWNLSQNMSNDTLYRRNIYSEDLLKTLYVDSEMAHIKEQMDTSVTNGDSKDGGGGKVLRFDNNFRKLIMEFFCILPGHSDAGPA